MRKSQSSRAALKICSLFARKARYFKALVHLELCNASFDSFCLAHDYMATPDSSPVVSSSAGHVIRAHSLVDSSLSEDFLCEVPLPED